MEGNISKITDNNFNSVLPLTKERSVSIFSPPEKKIEVTPRDKGRQKVLSYDLKIIVLTLFHYIFSAISHFFLVRNEFESNSTTVILRSICISVSLGQIWLFYSKVKYRLSKKSKNRNKYISYSILQSSLLFLVALPVDFSYLTYKYNRTDFTFSTSMMLNALSICRFLLVDKIYKSLVIFNFPRVKRIYGMIKSKEYRSTLLQTVVINFPIQVFAVLVLFYFAISSYGFFILDLESQKKEDSSFSFLDNLWFTLCSFFRSKLVKKLVSAT